jgi:aldehyde:ferredoxin oxidoreductase
MEAVSAGGTCLFSTYAMLPEALIKKPNSSLARIVNKAVPYFGGIVAFLHSHKGLMSLNIKNVLPHPYSIKLVTGFKMNVGNFIRAGERGYNLERLINIRQGLTSSGDTLPKRLTDELQKTGDSNSRVRLGEMLGEYYRIRGWDSKGVPTKRRLKSLGLEGNDA